MTVDPLDEYAVEGMTERAAFDRPKQEKRHSFRDGGGCDGHHLDVQPAVGNPPSRPYRSSPTHGEWRHEAAAGALADDQTGHRRAF